MSFPALPVGTDLTTERLVLRPWSADDIAAVLADVRSPHWAADFPAEGDRVIAGVIADSCDDPTASGHRLIIERETGLVIGSIGLMWPPTEGDLEFGYGVVASRRGRGYATEATRALVAYALTLPPVHTVYAEVESTNPASVRVLEKAGLRRRNGDSAGTRFDTAGMDPGPD
ncbi:GNAT family N-acetyltransferase, partial [Embleya sp. NPDC059259]